MTAKQSKAQASAQKDDSNEKYSSARFADDKRFIGKDGKRVQLASVAEDVQMRIYGHVYARKKEVEARTPEGRKFQRLVLAALVVMDGKVPLRHIRRINNVCAKQRTAKSGQEISGQRDGGYAWISLPTSKETERATQYTEDFKKWMKSKSLSESLLMKTQL